MRLAAARAGTLERMHAAMRLVAGRARAGQMDPERAIALIVALLEGHAVAQVTPSVQPGKARIAIVAAADAPPELRALLEQAQPPELDPAESDLLKSFRTEVSGSGGGGRGTLQEPSAIGRAGGGTEV